MKKRVVIALVIVAVLVVIGAWFTWEHFFREGPLPTFANADERFMYGSIGGEYDAGVPYWILYVLPRVFPDKLPGPGGYAAFGLSWEQGRELPVGFTKRRIGFDRVAQNCAVCHTASLRTSPNENPRFIPTGPAHTFNLYAFFRFLVDCAKDPRFNSRTLMNEIELSRPKELSWIDRQIYRYVLIPITRRRLLERETQFAWVYNPNLPAWGRGRDDAMNLTKYFLIKGTADDNTTGPTDMPSVWNLKKYHPEQGMRLNLAGDSLDPRSVIIDSALGLLGAKPHSNDDFLGQVKWLEDYLGNYPPPKFTDYFPKNLDAAKAQAGKPIFDAQCARCHASELTGHKMPVTEPGLGTDRERLWSWNANAAFRANREVERFGIIRPGLDETWKPEAYVVSFLDGIWLRAPYLHNGSVPTLRDLLNPVEQRPKVFYRGYDVYDPVNLGFITQGAEAQRVGTRYDVTARAASNAGHVYGVGLTPTEKDQLIEYLKTF